MGQRITAVSFEADGVQVATVLFRRNGLAVERVLTLQPDEFEAFLAHDATDDYLLAVNPADAIFETIQIPPVDKKLEPTLVRSEAARLHPELGQFSCSYLVLDDLPADGRVLRKIACCLIPHETLLPILEPFIRYNRTVRQMVATPHILAALVDEQLVDHSEPVLCAHDDGHSKTLFLLDDGAVKFSRTIGSNGYGWDPLDRQNITMTLDYCFQSLRVRATRVLVLNTLHEDDPDQPSPRLERFITPALFDVIQPETVQTAMVPLALALYRFQGRNDLLPDSYCNERLKQRLFRTGSILFGIVALCMLVLTVIQLFSISSTNEAIARLRSQEDGLTETVRSYRQALAERDRLQPLAASWNSQFAAPDIPRTLAALNQVTPTGISLTTLTLRRENDAMQLQLAGTVQAEGYARTQERFEAYRTALSALAGLQATRAQLDPKGQQFTLEAVYKP
ncbi:MAG: hypothetical protein FIA89_08910 [Geobacter sp.]|nr:hypothetical protein [Geobacter sp.]